MSNLRDLFISQSFYGIINLENSLEPLSSASGDVELQDGIGDNLGIKILSGSNDFEFTGSVTVDEKLTVQNGIEATGSVDVSGSLRIHGDKEITGSLDVKGDITAHTGSFDTINTRVLHVTLESSSVIFSSGSNQLGDEITDEQELIGQVTISGSLGVEGDSSITGSLTVSNEISSSTINGIGNVTQFSQSVDSRLDELEGPFSTSVDQRLDSLESYTSSQDLINSGYNAFTQSTDNKFNTLETYTASVDISLTNLNSFTSSQETINGFYNSFTASNGNDSLNVFTSSQLDINSGYNTFTSSYYVDSASFDTRIDALEDFSSSLVADFVTDAQFNPYTASTDNRLNNLELETSSIDSRLDNIELETSSLQTEIDGLSSQTSSYARLDIDNTFENNNFFSGSVRGSVYNIPIVSSTASIDCSQGNFFTLAQNTSSDTLLNATNITGGRTITLRVTKTNPDATITIDTGSIKFPSGFTYSITDGTDKQDVLTFVSFDTGSLYAVASKNFV